MPKEQRLYAHVSATMRMEGMPLNASDTKRLLACLKGEQSFEQNIKALVAKHSLKPGNKVR